MKEHRPDAGPTRREFLRLAGATGGTGVVLALGGCGGSKAALPRWKAGARVPSLRARAGVSVKHDVQRLRSRPDLRPPQIIIDTPARSVRSGVILTDCHAGPAQQGPLILDARGRMLWFWPLVARPSPMHRAFNLRVQSYRGEPVLTWFAGAVVSGHGRGHYEIYDQSYREVAQVHAGNGFQGDLHEFFLTSSGTAVFTCYGTATAMLPAAGGARRGPYFYGVVQEVDVATGKVLFQWRSDDHVGFGASYQPVPRSPHSPWDYFHINSIALDPSDGQLWISSRNTSACYKVNRTTGKVIWKLGGKDSDFEMGPHTHFAFQHHITPQAGGSVTIFDNEVGPHRASHQSRGLVLAVDARTRRARFVRQYLHRPSVYSRALGSVQELAGGHTFMGWGTSSFFTEYGRGSQVLFDGRLAAGTLSYRALKQPWTGQPMTTPALYVERLGRSASLYASWNGATEITRWGVLGGQDPQHLAELGTASWAGFETEISLPGAPPHVAVAALDGSRQVLAQSRTVAV